MLYVHADHLSRPIRLTDAAKVTAWAVEWLPWGGVHSVTGSETLNARFPGQWFQVESGLHYNWHRHYDPSLGRYTQPDPLGFVDGPSVYAYVGYSPLEWVDIEGASRRNPFTPRRVPGRIQYNPNALDFTPQTRPERSPPNVCALDLTGKLHTPTADVPRSSASSFRRQDLEEIRDNLQRSVVTREREQRELGESGSHRRRLEQERDLLKTVEKLLSES